MNTAELWTDGSAGNGGGPAGGWAYVLRVLNEQDQLIGWRLESGYMPAATSQSAELMAAYQALHAAWMHEQTPLVVRVYTDSKYVTLAIQGIEKPQANLHLVQKIKEQMDKFELMRADVTVEHVPGHSGYTLNEVVDGMAREAALMSDGGRYYGTKGKTGDSQSQRAVRADAQGSRRPARKPASPGRPAGRAKGQKPKDK